MATGTTESLQFDITQAAGAVSAPAASTLRLAFSASGALVTIENGGSEKEIANLTDANSWTGLQTLTAGLSVTGGTAAEDRIVRDGSGLLRLGGDATSGGSLDAGTTPVLEWTSSDVMLNKAATVKETADNNLKTLLTLSNPGATAAAGNTGSFISFVGKDTSSTEVNYGYVGHRVTDDTPGAHSGYMSLFATISGAATEVATFGSAISLKKPTNVTYSGLNVFEVDSGAAGNGVGVRLSQGTDRWAIQCAASSTDLDFYSHSLGGNVIEVTAAGAATIGPSSGGIVHRLNTDFATSAVAGTNGAVPAQVAGYVKININGTVRRIPYYADS